jgi:hypothetical protein
VQSKHPDLDGVWFNDDLNVNALSASRGMIFKNKLEEWLVSLSEQ